MNKDFKIRCPKCGSDKCIAVDQDLPSFDEEWLKECGSQFDDEHYTQFRCECGKQFRRVLNAVDSVELYALKIMALEVIRLGLYQGTEIESIVERFKTTEYASLTGYYSLIRHVNNN